MSTVVLNFDGAYIASCGACAYTEACLTESIAQRHAAEHEREHTRWTRTQELFARLAQRTHLATAIHAHTWRCTEESCPGQGFPTRADLVAAHRKKRGR